MELRQLRHFVAIADLLSFSRAAEALGLSQQGVSKSLSQLEAHIGVKLVERSRTLVALTEQGETLLPYARTIIAETQRFDDVLADLTGQKFGQLKIGGAPTLLADILPQALAQFHQRYPRTRIAVQSGDFKDLRDRLLEGELDIVLATAPEEAQSHLIALESILSDRNIVVVRAGHPLAERDRITQADLAAFGHVMIERYGKGETYRRRLFAGSEHPVPRPALTTTSVEFAISWIERSDHWWITPRRQIERAIGAGTLVEIPVEPADAGWPLVIATRRHATRSPSVHAFTTILRESVTSTPTSTGRS